MPLNLLLVIICCFTCNVCNLGFVACFAVTFSILVKSRHLMLRNTRGISLKYQCKASVLSK